jgi:hypothetical protein
MGRWTIWLAGSIWLGVVAGTLLLFQRAEAEPGDMGELPATWPAASRIPRAGDRPTLLVFAHPFCPCTRATLAELDRLARRLAGRAAIEVRFVSLDDERGWTEGDLWDRARRVAGAQVAEDRGGVEADLFGSRTSGQVLLYRADGALAFRGGLTISRGHEGESPGADRILALVAGESPERADAPVFGCPLQDPVAELETR